MILKRAKFSHKNIINLKGNYWRKRNFEDGKIDWRMDADNILNLIKGLGKPYKGSHFFFNKRIIKVWKAKIFKLKKQNLEPGKVIKINNSCPIIKCGKHSIMLLEYHPNIKIKLNMYL